MKIHQIKNLNNSRIKITTEINNVNFTHVAASGYLTRPK